MIDLIAVIVCTFLVELLVYAEQRIKHVAKRDSKYVVLFLMVTVYACRIPVHSVVYRLLAETGAGLPAQEILIGTVVVILSYLLRKLLVIYWKENSEKFFFYTASLVFLFNILVFVIWGNVTNEIFFACYFVSAMLSVYVVKKKGMLIEFPKMQESKSRWKLSLPISLFTGLTFLIYYSSELYVGNFGYFKVSYWKFIMPLLLTGLFFELIYMLTTCFMMTRKQYLFCNIFAFIFTLLSNLQGIFLNGHLKTLNGLEQTWTKTEKIFNFFVWILIVVGIYYYFHSYAEKARKSLIFISCGGIITEVISLLILLVMFLPNIKTDNFGLSTEKELELSRKDNIVVFVLDWFDNQVAEQILDYDETFFDSLDGFVHYNNATSKYAVTNFSVPYMLTGVEWEKGQSDVEYVDISHEKSDVLEQMNMAGYNIGIYTDGSYLGENERKFVCNGCRPVDGVNMKTERSIIAKVVRYRTMPFIIKKGFEYSDADLYGMHNWICETHNCASNIQFAKQVMDKGITINADEEKVFRFIHIQGAHAPYRLCENYEEGDSDLLTQSRLSFNLVLEFLQQMKKKDVYKDAMIIITADHGQNYFDSPKVLGELGLQMISSPIMFVKMPGEANVPLRISQKPVSHEEIIPTILKTVIGNSSQYGRTFEEIQENNRERVFLYGDDHYPFEKYIINGDVMDEESWSEPIPLGNE